MDSSSRSCPLDPAAHHPAPSEARSQARPVCSVCCADEVAPLGTRSRMLRQYGTISQSLNRRAASAHLRCASCVCVCVGASAARNAARWPECLSDRIFPTFAATTWHGQARSEYIPGLGPLPNQRLLGTHARMHSLTHPLTHSGALTHSLTHARTHTRTHSLITNSHARSHARLRARAAQLECVP